MTTKDKGVRIRLPKLFAILFFGPYLIYKGNEYSDRLLIALGIIFIIYELIWTLNIGII